MKSEHSEAGSGEPVQYYLAVPGLPGAELALLAARGALLAHRRFRTRPGYGRWLAGTMAKVVLRAGAEEVAGIARAHDGLLLPEPPDQPLLAVLRPRPRSRAPFVAGLKLYAGSVGAVPGAAWPAAGLWVPLFANGDLDLSAGKMAAQTAHAALALLGSAGGTPRWAAWQEAGMPMALLRVPGAVLRRLALAGQACAVADAGRTAVPGGSLTVAAGPPSDPDWWPRDEATLLAAGDARSVPRPRPTG